MVALGAATSEDGGRAGLDAGRPLGLDELPLADFFAMAMVDTCTSVGVSAAPATATCRGF